MLEISIKIYYNLDANNIAFSKNDFNAFISNLLLVHTFLTEYTFNTPSWSISAEFITYIFFSLLLFFNSGIIFSFIVYKNLEMSLNTAKTIKKPTATQPER